MCLHEWGSYVPAEKVVSSLVASDRRDDEGGGE